MVDIDFDEFIKPKINNCDWCRREVSDYFINSFDGRVLCSVDKSDTNNECWKVGAKINRSVRLRKTAP